MCDSGAKRRRPCVVKQAGDYQPNLRRVWSAAVASASLNHASFQWTSKHSREQVSETVVTISEHTTHVFWSTSTRAQGMLEASPISFIAAGSVIMAFPLNNGKTLMMCSFNPLHVCSIETLSLRCSHKPSLCSFWGSLVGCFYKKISKQGNDLCDLTSLSVLLSEEHNSSWISSVWRSWITKSAQWVQWNWTITRGAAVSWAQKVNFLQML